MIFSISWRAGVSPRAAARTEIERPTKSGRNTSLVMSSCQFGADREDLHLPLARICTRWIGGSGFIDVITADGTRRDPTSIDKGEGRPLHPLRLPHVITAAICSLKGSLCHNSLHVRHLPDSMRDWSVLVGGFALAGLVLFLTYPVAA
jgi:hypothetical protein